MKEFWSKRIRGAVPYTPGEQPRDRVFIKLNTNECPYPPSPRVMEAVRTVPEDTLRLYPDPECLTLRQTIAEYYGLGVDEVFAGNGSDEILAFCFQAFFDPDRPIVFPVVSYSFYPVYVDYFGLTARTVLMNHDFSIPVEELCSGNGGVVLANPNAPTGIAVGLDTVRRVLDANPEVAVIVDEAYVGFGAESAVSLIAEYPNLVVVQTMSKGRGLAGLRVGWALGQKNMMDALRCVRDSINSYTVDRLAMAGATASMKDEPYFRATCKRIADTRHRTAEKLTAQGFSVLPSQSNFLFISHPITSGRVLLDGLRSRGILVRWWNDPRIENYLRITVGTDEEMDALCAALAELVP